MPQISAPSAAPVGMISIAMRRPSLEQNEQKARQPTPTRRSAHRTSEPDVLFLGRTIREGIMIHHLSIAARDPKRAADALAEIMGGRAVPFPPNPGSFFALQLDDHGSGVEVYPAGTELQPAGAEGGSFVKQPREGHGFGATHFALSVATDA